MSDEVSEKEGFELSYQVFLKTLRLVSKDAESQCEIMDYYNVAGELKDELSAGMYLLNLPGGDLSDEKKYAIEQLINELKKIPSSVISEATTIESNLAAMQHPSWEPIRKHAAILLRTLGFT